MKNSLIFSIMLVIFLINFGNEKAFSQVPLNTFSINASFSEEWNDVGLAYSISEDFEIGGGLGLKNTSYSVSEGDAPESETLLSFYGYGLYYLTEGKYVSPFLRVMAQYWTDSPKKVSEGEVSSNFLGVSLSFGAQAFITKGIAVHADLGIGFQTIKNTTSPTIGAEYSETTNMLKLFTSSVGASFYF